MKGEVETAKQRETETEKHKEKRDSTVGRGGSLCLECLTCGQQEATCLAHCVGMGVSVAFYWSGGGDDVSSQ